MTDELKRLEEALRGSSPEPPAAARERAMTAAMAAFDAEHPSARQGLRGAERHTGRASSFLETVFRRRPMNFAHPNLRHVLAGGAVIAVLAVVVVNNLTVGPTPIETPATNAISAAPDSGGAEVTVAQRAAVKEREGDGVAAERDGTPSPASGIGAEDYPFISAAQDGRADEEEQRGKEALGARMAEAQRQVEARVAQLESDPAALEEHRQQPEVQAEYLQYHRADGAAPAAGQSGERAWRGESGISASVAVGSVAEPTERIAPSYRDQGRDRFTDFETNPVKVVSEEPVSTFSIDVDTASYSFLRATLHQGALPPQDAVRVEELINYFPYDYAAPEDREAPFAAGVSLMPAPWNAATRLMHIGIRGYALKPQVRPRANLVFLIDTSGSMDEPNKLPLLINSLKLLLEALRPDDTVAIVTYAGSAGTALEPTPVAERSRILASLERLRAGGSTAGAEGIRQAYLLAEGSFAAEGVNRVILATDGDFNVGITDPEELESYVARKRSAGVFLSVLGFGMGNYNDALMQTLAQNGNGNAAYIDTLLEARKVLVEEATSTLFPIAKDVKIQIEFNPALVSEYRLLGYETRMLAREDFSNDRIDAGEIGSGHTVTAIYELTPAGSGAERIEPLRYRTEADEAPGPDFANEYAFLKIRYKLPDGDTSTLMVRPVTRADHADSFATAPREARFAAAVAGFGQLLRGGRYTGDYGFDDVIELARGAKGEDRFGYRAEFVNLVRLAKSAAALERPAR